MLPVLREQHFGEVLLEVVVLRSRFASSEYPVHREKASHGTKVMASPVWWISGPGSCCGSLRDGKLQKRIGAASGCRPGWMSHSVVSRSQVS